MTAEFRSNDDRQCANIHIVCAWAVFNHEAAADAFSVILPWLVLSRDCAIQTFGGSRSPEALVYILCESSTHIVVYFGNY